MLNRDPLRWNAMRWFAAAVLGTVIHMEPASAEDVPPPGSSGNPHIAIDSTLDYSTFSHSFDINALVPLGGHLNESGFRARFTAATSGYKFPSGEPSDDLASGRSHEGDILVGYGWSLPRLSIVLVGGYALIESINDPGIRRTQSGGKAVLSIYGTPTDQTMTYSRFQYSTINEALELQMKGGVKIFNFAYLGPEGKFASRIGSEERRFGPHLSGVTLGPVSLSLSAGWLFNSVLGSGRYVSGSAYAAF